MSHLSSKKIFFKKSIVDIFVFRYNMLGNAPGVFFFFQMFHFQFKPDTVVTAYCLGNPGDQHACAADMCVTKPQNWTNLLILN